MKFSKKVLPFIAVFLFSYSLSFAEGTYKESMESGDYDKAVQHADGKRLFHDAKRKRYNNTLETNRRALGKQPAFESEANRQATKHNVKLYKWVHKRDEAKEAERTAPVPPPYEALPGN